MKKVKALTSFSLANSSNSIKYGEEIELEKNLADRLAEVQYVEILEEIKIDETPKKPSKKKPAKKKDDV